MAETNNTKKKTNNAANTNKKGNNASKNASRNNAVKKNNTKNSNNNNNKKNVNTKNNNGAKKNTNTKTATQKKPVAKTTVQKNTSNTTAPVVELPKIKEVKKTEVVEEVVTPKQEEVKIEPVVEIAQEKEIILEVEEIKVEPIVEVIEEKKEEPRHAKKLEKVKEPKQQKVNTNKGVDLGILIVIIGLFILVLTTYLSSDAGINLTMNTTKILIVAALIVEAIGMLVMIINIWRKK